LLAFNETSMYNFFVAFMGVFFCGQATAQMFQFSTSQFPCSWAKTKR
jgi:ATP-binding cassette subfamily B (MDR/TAP) protein 1